MITLRSLWPFVSVTCLCLGLGMRVCAADPEPKPKPGYQVVLDVNMDEKGMPGNISVVSSDDTTLNHILEQIAMEQVRHMKPNPRIKDGHAVKYIVRAPFVFPVAGDEGADSNLAPKPSLRGKFQTQPVYPADLAAKGETGGAIVELIIGADGNVRDVSLLRSSNLDFANSAITAVKQWKFEPAMKAGAAVSSRWRLAVSFQMDTQYPDWEWRIAPRPSLGNYTVMHRTQALPGPAPDAPTGPAAAPGPAK